MGGSIDRVRGDCCVFACCERSLFGDRIIKEFSRFHFQHHPKKKPEMLPSPAFAGTTQITI